MNDDFYTPGVLAAQLGAQPHHVNRLIARRAIPFFKAGRFHFISAADIEKVRAALINAGYLKGAGADVALAAS